MFTVGEANITRIPEMALDTIALRQLLPAIEQATLARYPQSVPPGANIDSPVTLSVHSWLVRHRGMTILIDTGIGNDKNRPKQPFFDHLDTPFLDRLAEAGCAPEDVDYVLHTHIHADHVGWNTRLIDGLYVPTFPNATIICSRLEWDYAQSLEDGDEAGIQQARARAGLSEPVRTPFPGTFADSMRPLGEAGRVRLIDMDGPTEILPGIRLMPAAGHSIDHAVIELTSDDEKAAFFGDVAHHPIEFHDMSLVSGFCEFPDAARAARRKFADRVARSEALCFSAHFPGSSVGRVTVDQGEYGWMAVDAA